VCRTCTRVANGLHPDVHLVDRARDEADKEEWKKSFYVIKVDQVRQAQQTLARHAVEGRARVLVIADADRLDESAQNALLKGLEEPGDAENVLILLVPGTRAVLPTIASIAAMDYDPTRVVYLYAKRQHARNKQGVGVVHGIAELLTEASSESATGPAGFLARAVAFANDVAWGNLTATLLVHPAVQRDAADARAVDEAVAALRYGAIGINTFGSFCYVTPSLPWGAFPGNAAVDIQSGTGFVNNVLDLPAVQKAVLRAPFRVGRAPPLDLRRRSTAPLLQAVAGLEHRPSVAAFVQLARAAWRP
jgi:hypothetical protein